MRCVDYMMLFVLILKKKKHEVQEETTELEDHKMMSQYLPLLREVMPSAAEEIESEIHNYKAKQAEHNPWNDYPDEEESEDEDEDEDETQSSEVVSSTSQDQYGFETVGVISFQNEDVGREDWSDPLVDGESGGEAYYDDDDDEDDMW
ncbi:RNA-directed DNA methylation 4-like [Nicotiana tomentosiformis]|uniref:RNA-directed DNA methylation 4-like n=1 Tax=Nicotiana tomentosiformis TaxID=4098 RepID=UPI00388C9CE2